MSTILNTKITAVGPEVADLAEGGVVILFAEGSPPELAEVSILHAPVFDIAATAPAIGSKVIIGDIQATITAIGPDAWAKVMEIGHIVLTFNGSSQAERPGEMCLSEVSASTLVAALKEGNTIAIES